jgi:RNA polymerase sigma-70 factor (ECF subfamily)
MGPSPRKAKRYGLYLASSLWMTRPLRLVASDGVSVPEAAEPQSFEDFFEAESPALFRRLCLITGNRHEAEEVMQDAFLSLFERWDRIRHLEDPTGYLYRTAFNAFRRRSRRAALALRKTLGLAPAVDELEAADDRQVVSEALRKLSRRQRTALVLTELIGYGSEDAGKLMGVRPVTVRALASQGRAAMRRILERRHE